MYSARIVTDKGRTVEFSLENGVLFDIAPLSGVDVSLSTTQGFRQIGESVEGQGVSGINRTITGKLMRDQFAKQMLSALPVFTSGKLYFNNSHYCDIVVKKTPEFVNSKGAVRFTMQVYCPDPFWKQITPVSLSLGGLTKLFKFPVEYNTHKFGERSEAKFINCFNAGDVDAPYKLVLTTTTEATNYGIINQKTLKEARFTDTLSAGEVVTLWQERGRIFATKENDGVITNHLGYLSDSSDLFSLDIGDNVLKVVADTGENDIIATAEFTPAYMGVLA